jgi:basic membrane protein A
MSHSEPTPRKLPARAAAVAGIAATLVFSIAGCAKPPGTESGSSGAPSSSSSGGAATDSSSFKACMVSDSGGFDDKSFNQTSHKGLLDAKKKLGIETDQVESKNDSDYANNMQAMVDAKCSVIVGVGFKLGDAILTAAKANPDIDFAIVDDNEPRFKGVKNLKPLVFNTAQSAFLGGYLAASMTKTDKIGTFGGDKIPTVTIYMDGFAQGVEYYNKQNNKKVQVLGWNVDKQDGQFVPGSDGFKNIPGGKQVASNLISQGADIIFPVAGNSGVGALQAVKASGGKVSSIWVDTDGCVSDASYCSTMISSVYKSLDLAVEDAITAAHDKNFSNEPYVGTLSNKGTGLTPYHDFASKVPEATTKKLDELKADIISGKIKITSKAQPQT